MTPALPDATGNGANVLLPELRSGHPRGGLDERILGHIDRDDAVARVRERDGVIAIAAAEFQDRRVAGPLRDERQPAFEPWILSGRDRAILRRWRRD